MRIEEDVERTNEAINTQNCSLGLSVRGEGFARRRRRSENATKMDLERNVVRVWNRLDISGQVAVDCEHGNAYSTFIKRGKFLD